MSSQSTLLKREPADGIPCELVSWEQFYQLARGLARLVRKDGFKPDIIVAISRGGLMPARILSDHLCQFDLATLKVEHYHALNKEPVARIRYPLTAEITGRRVLLVDDVSDSGDSLEVAIAHLLEQGKPADLRSAVLHHKSVSRVVPDYFTQELIEWRWLIYPWAVIEDLTSLLAKATRPLSSETCLRYLQQQHTLIVPEQILLDVLSIMDEVQQG